MNRRDKVVIFSIAILLMVVLGLRVTPVLVTGGGNSHQEIHWIVYGYDRVWYHSRTYLGPSKELSLEQVKKQLKEGESLIPTGERAIGLAVYNSPNSIKLQKQNKVVPTLLILKKYNGNFIEYSLSGGP